MCARFVPAVVTFVPVAALIYLLLVQGMPTFYNKAYTMIHGHVNSFWKNVIVVMLVYFWGMLVRMFSKWCESKFFKDELHFPTTDFLMWSNQDFPVAFKRALHAKVANDAGFGLLTIEDELRDEREARLLIATAVARMRDKTRGNKIVFWYNVTYGFVRNLTAGSVFSLVASLALLCLGWMRGPGSTLFALGFLFTLIYLLLIVLAKPLCGFAGKLYARALINAYYNLWGKRRVCDVRNSNRNTAIRDTLFGCW